jgi:general L-amino acid transport system substrate-binding protein
VRYVPTTAQVRFTALQVGRGGRAVAQHHLDAEPRHLARLRLRGDNFYDGQGFMVKRSLGVTSARALDGATVCVQPGTTTEQNLADWARGARVQIRPW